LIVTAPIAVRSVALAGSHALTQVGQGAPLELELELELVDPPAPLDDDELAPDEDDELVPVVLAVSLLLQAPRARSEAARPTEPMKKKLVARIEGLLGDGSR
jgi:hypothetical protein